MKNQKNNLQEKLAKARANGQAVRSIHPYAVYAKFDSKKNKVLIEFNNGTEFAFPPDLAQGLSGASHEQLAEIEITPSGLGLHWEALDADLSIPDLLNGIYGNQNWMASLGQKGGRSTSDAKTIAARENGKKGGRPKKAVPCS